jgi:hypothetical protein
VNASLTSVTPIAALATASSILPASFVGVPAGVAGPVAVQTSGYPASGTQIGANAVVSGSGGAIVTLRSNVIMTRLSATAWATGTSPSPAAAGATFGPVEVLGRLQFPPGTRGNVTITYSRVNPVLSGTATIVNQGLIDIDADGTPELVAPSSVVLRRTVGANGELLVRIVMENHATTTGTLISTCNFSASFVPDPPATCTITSYGTPCGGAQSSGSESSLGALRAITLLSSGGFARAPVVSTFGTQNSGPVLPGGCQLLNEASMLMLLTSDASGFATQVITVPVSAIGTLYQQFVPIDPATLAIRASNGLAIDCAL